MGCIGRGSRAGRLGRRCPPAVLSTVLPAVLLALVASTTVAAHPARASGVAARGDPSDLLLGTYLGGGGDECSDLGSRCPVDIARGGDGSIYVVGSTESTDFPTTAGAYDTVGGTNACPVGPECPDAFVARLDPTGSSLIFSTYLGGSGSDCFVGCSIAVDPSGAAYVTGGTDSRDFPTTLGAPDRLCGTDGTCNGGSLDGFVAKLSADGSSLLSSTFLGGSDDDWGWGIAAGPNGAAYAVGATYSDDFPVTPGAFDTSFNRGYVDAFVTKVAPSGTAFAYSTYVGGTLGDLGVDVAVRNGSVYAVGYTNSYDFPTSEGAFDRSADGSYDGFLFRLNAQGSKLLLGTYLGGGGVDCFEACAVGLGPGGNPVVAGATQSSGFPTTPGSFDTTFGGGSWCACDGFVTEFDATASHLVYSSFVGGSGADFVHGLAVSPTGEVTLVGETDSPDLAVTPGAYQRRFGGGFSDVFVLTVLPDGTALGYATYVGGKGSDCLGECALAIAAGPVAYVAADNREGHFPTTSGAFRTKRSGGIDAVVAELDISG